MTGLTNELDDCAFADAVALGYCSAGHAGEVVSNDLVEGVLGESLGDDVDVGWFGLRPERALSEGQMAHLPQLEVRVTFV